MKEKENTNVPLVIGATKSLKPFKHSPCSSDFKSKQSLKNYIEKIYEGKKLFCGTICNVRFHLKKLMQRDTLKSLMKEKRPSLVQFVIIDFSRKGDLNLHIKRQH